MAVIDQIQLPLQPASGTTIFGPLGGNGYTSPLGRYEVDATLVMDGTTGAWRIAMHMDLQYMSLVSIAQMETNEPSDTIAFAIDIKQRAATNIYRVAGDMKQLDSASANVQWCPPPIIDPVTVDFRMLNTDTFTGRATCTIYLFKKGAQHIVPVFELMKCLIRAGSVT